MELWKINFTLNGKPLANIINEETEQKARQVFLQTMKLNYARLAEKMAVDISITAVTKV